MPVFAQFIAGLFANIFAGIGKSLLKKLTAVAAALATLAAAAVTMKAAFDAAVSSLVPALPSIITIPASWVVPDNVTECITARITVGLAIMAYQWAKTVTVVGASA